MSRPENIPTNLTANDARDFLRYLASQSHLQDINFLWRPFLKDPDDDMILELAFAAKCPYILTHNVKDFSGSEKFGIKAIPPAEFLRQLETGQ